MILQELEVRDFRNYHSQQLQLSPDVNIFVGQNAQGKTNILEAVCLLALAKSHRTHRDAELILWDAKSAYVAGRLNREERTYTLDLTIFPKGKKVRVNQVEKRKISDFIGYLNIVLFAPEDLLLVKGGPQARRRFLDVEIGQVSPHYVYNLSQYAKVLIQRNNLLKDAGKGNVKSEFIQMLSIWDTQLSVDASKIIKKRLAFLQKLQKFACNIHRRITGDQEELQLHYRSTLFHDQAPSELSTHILEEIQKKHKQDLLRGTTSIGPHRDDVEVMINGRNVNTYGSQGQQRTAALSMKLAEIELIRHEVGEYPVLLLDDVLSELDETRQLHLLQSMGERVQTLITTTSTYGLERFIREKAHVYHVCQGVIKKEGS